MAMQAHAVIVGAGIAGCSVARHLADAGWRDVVLIDQGAFPETGGSTSHAPSNIFRLAGSALMTRFAVRSAEFYGRLGAFRRVGGIELAGSVGRHDDLKRKLERARAYGITDAELIGPARAAALSPLIDPDRVLAGLRTEGCGVADALGAAAAAAEGIRVLARTEVLGLDVRNGRCVGVSTAGGRITADHVVLAAGVWGPKLAAGAGLDLPLVPVDHQLLVTGPLPELAAHRDTDIAHPILREQELKVSIRQMGDRYAIGNYNRVPRLVDPRDIAAPDDAPVMPSLLDFRPEEAVGTLDACGRLLPAIVGAGLSRGLNGLFAFTPDNAPLLGPSGVLRLWLAEALWISHAGGAAQALAHWMAEGEPAEDLREVDPARFRAGETTRRAVWDRGRENYMTLYDIRHPASEPAPRAGLRRMPARALWRERGAVAGVRAGLEVPLWFAREVPAVERDPWAAGHWSPEVADEAREEGPGVLDLSGREVLEIRDLAGLDQLTASDIDKPGPWVFADGGGRLRGFAWGVRAGPDRALVFGTHGRSLAGWLAPQVAATDLTAGIASYAVFGPVGDLAEGPGEIDGVPYRAFAACGIGRGCLEVHATADLGAALAEALLARGCRPVGERAASDMAVTAGVPRWGRELSWGVSPDEAGLGGFAQPDKSGFLGQAALRREADIGSARRLARLRLPHPRKAVLGDEPVYRDGRVADRVRSAGTDWRDGSGLAYAYLPTADAVAGTRLEVGPGGDREPAVVETDPPWRTPRPI